jgi:hypothetical protein
MFTPVIAEALRRRGHDVIAVAAVAELRSLTDAELYAFAKREGRRLVTENVKDSRRLLMQDEESGRPGVLFTSSRSFPRSRSAPGALIAARETWLSEAQTVAPLPEVWLRRPDADESS